jgi:hypothetical protein
MANLRLNVRRDPLGRVTVDIPGPQCTLSTMQPVGAHLTIQLSDEHAAMLRDQLTRLLEGKPTHR